MSATSQPTPTPAAPRQEPATTDERLVPISRVTRAMRRPELGALMAAVAVWILFAITDASSNHLWLNQTGLAA
jgi:hypothetical protein